jgi:ABC-type Fe3+/spermidine/putrescine transport system ATPase subunit
MLKVENLVKSYRTVHGTVQAVKNVSFEVGTGEIVTLLGPSGCGKTTILRCVAGLERPDSGTISIDGEPVFSDSARRYVPTHARPIAMVFQSYAIWPHMTVAENVAYPLTVGRHKPNKREIADRVAHALELVRIPELAQRSATLLSGGQQQRVAVARALIRKAKLILFDEPLSNLDAKLREEMRIEFKELFSREAVSALYVTHDLLEALVLSHRVVVMNSGNIAQSGSPRDVYSHPRDEFMADFMGAGNVIEGKVAGEANGFIQVDVGFGTLSSASNGQNFSKGQSVIVAIRPEAITLSGDVGLLSFPCRVLTDAFLGTGMEYLIALQEHRLRVRMPPTAAAFDIDDEAFINIRPESCVVLQRLN